MSEKVDTDARIAGMNAHEGTLDELFLQANLASEQEKEVGVLEAMRRYPKEIFWAIIFALGLVMAGYDAQMISSL